MRLRARDVCLAVVVLVLVGTGLHAVVGEFTHHSWRTAIHGVNGGFPGVVPGRQCVAVSGGFAPRQAKRRRVARRSWATLSPFWARRRGACPRRVPPPFLWYGGAQGKHRDAVQRRAAEPPVLASGGIRSDGNGWACRGFTGHLSGFHDGFVTPHHERHGRGGYEGFRPAMCSSCAPGET